MQRVQRFKSCRFNRSHVASLLNFKSFFLRHALCNWKHARPIQRSQLMSAGELGFVRRLFTPERPIGLTCRLGRNSGLNQEILNGK